MSLSLSAADPGWVGRGGRGDKAGRSRTLLRIYTSKVSAARRRKQVARDVFLATWDPKRAAAQRAPPKGNESQTPGLRSPSSNRQGWPLRYITVYMCVQGLSGSSSRADGPRGPFRRQLGNHGVLARGPTRGNQFWDGRRARPKHLRARPTARVHYLRIYAFKVSAACHRSPVAPGGRFPGNWGTKVCRPARGPTTRDQVSDAGHARPQQQRARPSAWVHYLSTCAFKVPVVRPRGWVALGGHFPSTWATKACVQATLVEEDNSQTAGVHGPSSSGQGRPLSYNTCGFTL